MQSIFSHIGYIAFWLLVVSNQDVGALTVCCILEGMMFYIGCFIDQIFVGVH